MKKRLVKFAAATLLVSTLAPAVASAGCAWMEGSNVINGCNYRIIGNYKGSDGSWGGFGPISPGGREGTSKSRNAGYNMSWCNYDDWVNGTCRATHPNDL